MGPRPRGRGIGTVTFEASLDGTLQWGRDRAVAELSALLSFRYLLPPLQWGRDRAVAELKVQRQSAAKIIMPSMGPRPRGRGIEAGRGGLRAQDGLQWGRDRAVAEFG